MAAEIASTDRQDKIQPAAGNAGDPVLDLHKYDLLLATLVATVTYAAGFNSPGGVWQDTDATVGHLAGDPIIRDTHYHQYLVFFYCNATAFASSLVVIVLLVLAVLYEKKGVPKKILLPLRGIMVLDLISLMGAYAAGNFPDTSSTIYSTLLVAGGFIYLILQMVALACCPDTNVGKKTIDKRLRKILMLLATFAVSVTYVAGLSTPGGFWDNSEGGHRPGDAILKDHHDVRLKAFFAFNTVAFVASLVIVVLLPDKKLREKTVWSYTLYGWIIVALIGLVGAYAAGSCRHTDTTAYVVSLVGAVLAYIVFHLAIPRRQQEREALPRLLQPVTELCFPATTNDKKCSCQAREGNDDGSDKKCSCEAREGHDDGRHCFAATTWHCFPATISDKKCSSETTEQARSLVLLLATLAATITYQAGLDPPGGLWQDNGNGHEAGNPILLTTNARRYKVFFYCNSIAFVASLVAIILVRERFLLQHHVLEAAMILDLLGLIGAYAAGSCRDVNTSIHAMGLAGAVLVYVVIHVVLFTLDHKEISIRKNISTKEDEDEDKLVEKKRKQLLLFAVLAATITYQAGLTPPGGFRLQDDESGHHAGDPVLLYNYPRRYMAFFYCNSVSFMLSIALIILLVNPILYRPAIRSNALSVCTAAGLFSLMGAYAAGSTQHLKTSIYIFVLVAVVLVIVIILLLVILRMGRDPKNEPPPKLTGIKEDKEKHAKRKYLMLLGILVASVTYQAGLDPPGGFWQRNIDGHDAGNPVLHDSNRHRYLAFFYSNSTSFMASIVVILLLIPESLQKKWWLRVMNATIMLDLLCLLGAYAAGSNRGWKTSMHVIALVFAVMAYIAIHAKLLIFVSKIRCHQRPGEASPSQAESSSEIPVSV